MDFSYDLKIPRDRIAVLIGTKGEVKREIEEHTHTSIDVDSKEGDITIKGEDALGLYNAREVIKAISRGFNPEFARLLLKGDYALEIVSLGDYGLKEKNQFLRFKGRVIGREGKSRKTIEQLTDTYLVVYGKTIGIIGYPMDVANARKAIESLIGGSPHSHVYKWLEKKRREGKRREIAEQIGAIDD